MKKITSLTQLVPGKWYLMDKCGGDDQEMGLFYCLSCEESHKLWTWDCWFSDGERSKVVSDREDELEYIANKNYYLIPKKKADVLVSLWANVVPKKNT